MRDESGKPKVTCKGKNPATSTYTIAGITEIFDSEINEILLGE
jgi:hypothetical protein